VFRDKKVAQFTVNLVYYRKETCSWSSYKLPLTHNGLNQKAMR